MLWNPFRTTKLVPVVPSKNISPALGPETTDPAYVAEVERYNLRSLLARTQLTMLQEQLAEQSLHHMRGGNT